MIGGVSILSLDSKGRLAIPAKHRETLLSAFGHKLIVTLESQDHLLLYPEPNWRPVEARLLALPTGNPTLKRYQRLVLGHAETLEMDSAGRILLPARLRELTALDKDVALVGMGNRFELWNAEEWDSQTADALAIDQADLAQHLGDFTL
ncbi:MULTISPECIES: division/cell wall cluster transcriptional repressor MraZ [Chromobacterium]|uniref:Transcriptional regulator MraZ n=1 Tax=Chromobacterium sphagni TaxID=1903179 RepID=A0A1S1X1W1_9NEIS|nr:MULTISPECIES: division/cell wall cluster transcriptional repressor MraZ [Chromobacterium]OHX13524.1 cell division/cell wall cluster transcriptional repressor MraZ [Chromobacterium sphagni]OHX21981.1 cell division/cell wall cluster transcriptional repressor MraZ [Chromobacterium sphagni]UTH75574.1 division/cell wall cluster transcriptional repressor MraZ [Chromobacterium sp. IIBBL 290-4]